jgi:hypothetical protein
MPRSPDNCEARPPARKSKRTRRTTTPLRTNSTTSRAEVPVFLTHDACYPPETQQAIDKVLSLNPLELLALLLKVVLGDRIENEEIAFICRTHYQIIRYKCDEEEQ